MSKEVVKNTEDKKANRIAKNLEKKLLHVTTPVQINQCRTDKQNLEKRLKMLIKRTRR